MIGGGIEYLRTRPCKVDVTTSEGGRALGSKSRVSLGLQPNPDTFIDLTDTHLPQRQNHGNRSSSRQA